MKRLLLLLVSVVLCITFLVNFGACSSSSSSATVTSSTSTAVAAKTLKFAIPVPPGSIPVNTAEEWAAKFNSEAKGLYVMEVKPMLVGQEDMLPSIQSKAVEMGCGSLCGWAGNEPSFSVANLPFILNNFDANHACWVMACDRLFSKMLEDKFNVKVLASEDYGLEDVYGIKPIEKLEDWKGKLVDCEAPMEAKCIEALGGSAVPIPWLDELPSLEKGVVDAGVTTCWSALVDIKYYDVIQYATKADMKGTHGAYIINLDIFNEMPKDIQDLLVSGGQWFQNELNARMKASDSVAVAKMEEQGVKVTVLSDAERNRWVDATRSLSDEFFSSIDANTAKILKDCIAEANKQYPR